MKALIIVDMLNDAVAGAGYGTGRIVPSVRRLLDHARADEDWLVVYACDAHRADDREIAVRGKHAMAGTQGAMVIDDLAPCGGEREVVIPKRYYGAFDGTDLDDALYDYEVSELVLAGQSLDGAILHTVYGAFVAGYDVAIATDAVAASHGVDAKAELDRLVARFGVELTTSAGLIGRPVLRMAASGGGH